MDVFPSSISCPSSTECAMAITALPSTDRSIALIAADVQASPAIEKRAICGHWVD